MPGSTLIFWNDSEFVALAREEAVRRLGLIATQLEVAARANISKEGRPNNPRSVPGDQFPKKEGGTLAESIFSFVDEPSLTAVVGTNEPYGYWLEHGTVGGKTIRSKDPSGWLTWVNEETGEQVFAKEVKLGPIVARPWLSSTLADEEKTIRRIWETGR